MNLVRYFPKTVDLFDWESILDRFFETPSGHSRTPAVDIKENEKGYVMEVELPGLSDKDIEVKVENNRLYIASKEIKEEKEEKKEGYVRKERRSYRFERTFELPEFIDREKISAKMERGLLSIELPKAEEAKPKMIEVKVK